jgi:predicted dehydrogenase
VSGLRWGALSTAAIVRVVSAANPGRFRAVAGRDPARTAAFAAQTGIEQTFDGYAAMLDSDEIDAVYVALPPALHTEWTLAALKAGKHVLCEKPFAWSPADAASCFDAAEAAGRVCAEGFMWRTHPQTLLAQRLIADGAIGRPATIRAALRVSVGPGDIRRSPELGGGAFGDLGCYPVSAIRLFAGDPIRATADAIFEAPATAHSTQPLRVPPGATREVLDPYSSGTPGPVPADAAVNALDPRHGGQPAGAPAGATLEALDPTYRGRPVGAPADAAFETLDLSHRGEPVGAPADATLEALDTRGGKPVRVPADTALGVLDTRLGGVLQCPNGVLGVFDCALDLPRADELDIIGTEGVLHIPDPWLCTAGEIQLIRNGVTERLPADPDGQFALTGQEQDAYRIEFDTFEQIVAGTRPQPFGRADAVAQAATLEAVLRAARTGTPVTL